MEAMGSPRFFVSVASKGLRDSTSPLESILTGACVSVAFKGLTGRDNSALPIWNWNRIESAGHENLVCHARMVFKANSS
jgi:hypothetical protein